MGSRPVRAGRAGSLSCPPLAGIVGVVVVRVRAGGGVPAGPTGQEALAKGVISGACSRARSAEVSSGMASAARSASTRAR